MATDTLGALGVAGARDAAGARCAGVAGHGGDASPRRSVFAARGFTLVELIVTLTVTGVVLALLLPLVLTARSAVQGDQLRTTLQQNLRASAELVGTDIRLAGERFPPSSPFQLPPIEIVPGGDGEPDEIVLRRALWRGALPVCEQSLQGGNQTIRVVRDGGWLNSPQGQEHPECGQPVGSDGWPQNLGEVRALADSIGEDGVLHGYLFEPPTGDSEFIRFRVKDNAHQTGAITRATSDALQHAYTLGNRPRIYLLEERRYRVRDGLLEVVVNGEVDAPLRAAPDLQDMSFRYVLPDGTTAQTLPSDLTWRDIAAVEATFDVRTTRGSEEVERTLTSRFFPRNIMSR